jgi:hypothetical protein
MKAVLERIAPQPLIATVTVLVALTTLALSWSQTPLPSGDLVASRDLLLSLTLLAALIVAYRFPIHFRRASKIYLTTTLGLLSVTLLPVAFAATTIGIGTLVGEVLEQQRTGNYPSDIATCAGRTVLVAIPAALVAHLFPSQSFLASLLFVPAALVLWLGDALTAPLIYWPMTAEQPGRIVIAVLREAGLIEGTQYLIGLLGAVAAVHETWTLALLGLPMAVVYVAFKNIKELGAETRNLLESMADTVDLRDPYTGGHSRRVTALTAGILRELGLQGPEVDLVVSAARIHDIGKIAIPDAVLLKAGTLTAEERASMETHAERGAAFVERYPDFARGAAIIRHHHEAWDGSGYPHRLKGDEIPFGARVIAVADSYDAMTTDRPYRRGMSPPQAAMILRAGRGRQWDPKLVDTFLASIADRVAATEGPALRLVAADGALVAS